MPGRQHDEKTGCLLLFADADGKYHASICASAADHGLAVDGGVV